MHVLVQVHLVTKIPLAMLLWTKRHTVLKSSIETWAKIGAVFASSDPVQL